MSVIALDKKKDIGFLDISNKQPLLVVDSILHRLTNETYDKKTRTKVLSEFLKAISAQVFQDSPNLIEDKLDYSKVIFDKQINVSDKIFISVCLIRLLAADNSFFDIQFRMKTNTLFEDSGLYSKLRIDLKKQNYEIEQAIAQSVQDIEKQFRDIITINNLKTLQNFRQRFMQKIKSDAIKTIVHPFLPQDLLTDAVLEDIFVSVSEYYADNSIRKIDAFAKVQILLNKYVSKARDFGTVYSIDYLANFGENLLKLCKEDFEKSPFSKPAILNIEKTEKKYPLHTVGIPFSISLIITNQGSGIANSVSLVIKDSDLKITKEDIFVGDIHPGIRMVDIPVSVLSTSTYALAEVELKWKNSDGQQVSKNFVFEFNGQSARIDWETLETEDPYSLEAVTREDELIGRADLLKKLVSRSKARSVGSFCVYGQKRVGKTSLVRTLQSAVEKLSENYHVIYLEGGDYINPDPVKTINNLGQKLCEELRYVDTRINHLTIPEFNDGALSPLDNFLKSALRIIGDLKVIFILDEFDELPLDLFKRGPIGDSFFLTIRSISGKTPYGFILVGGEKMEYVMSCQGDALNKFETIRVDYFDKGKNWGDFEALVRKPVYSILEISDKALEDLYLQTSGNPFFTKLICSELFRQMVNCRDAHVTEFEIDDAVRRCVSNLTHNSFQHFWEDGIVDTGDRAEEISIQRRRILLIMADLIRQNLKVDKQTIILKAKKENLLESSVENHLREFERRQIIVCVNDSYEFKVGFFTTWLKERGINDIITTFIDNDVFLERKKAEEQARIKPEEIKALVNNWGTYQGRRITEDWVRTWINQFKDNIERRLMFTILQNVKFYTNDYVRSKLNEAHGIVKRKVIQKIEKGKRKRADIIVSYIDGPGKSGARFAKLYADENDIFADCVIEKSKLSNILTSREGIRSVVFVDDIIGSGESAVEYLSILQEEQPSIFTNDKLKLFFMVICGFSEGKCYLEKVLEKKQIPVDVYICDPLDELDKCFSSKVFADIAQNKHAKEIAYTYGYNLVKGAPLGYKGCEAKVVFEENCPNNTIPIIWASSKNWEPLFKRC